jgi:capsular polysaccharide biosynthesis protein
MQATFPGVPLVVFKGDKPAAEIITMFQQAQVIMGPHGAGLSHMLFAAPGTTGIRQQSKHFFSESFNVGSRLAVQ